ncbi:hypothetical protein DFS34DRAFT_617868 [Phlyctochytrium arcticum]|nr:hypothetical protein DFS34DRAFT_617868 [Phlyctochytrium arcticum]
MADTINFYSTSSPNGFMSNFYPARILVDGKLWPSTEHYFQAMKFSGTKDESIVEKIRLNDSPVKATQFGRNRTYRLRPDWDIEYTDANGKITKTKIEVMRKAVRAKFTQHLYLKEQLLDTAGKNIVEHTKNDSYWGDGGDGSGTNMLGKLLVELRDELLQEAD